jgi:hypothetical protein
VDKTTLVDKDISDGEKLIRKLDMGTFKVSSALWFYVSELSEWKLIIASEYVDKKGQKEAYKFIQKELEDFNPPIGIELSNINLIGSNHGIVSLLKSFFAPKSPEGFFDLRIHNIVLSGVMIEDAFIYKLN